MTQTSTLSNSIMKIIVTPIISGLQNQENAQTEEWVSK